MAGRMNNLTGKEWLQQSFSIWRDIGKTKDERKLKHPAMFPTQLTSRLIEIFTKDKGEVILDPFLGSGSTDNEKVWEKIDRLKGRLNEDG